MPPPRPPWPERSSDGAPGPSAGMPFLPALQALRRHEATRLLLAGVAIGILGGVAAAVFDRGMLLVGELILGTGEPAAEAPTQWRALVGPAITGLAAGLLVARLTKRGRPQGVPDVLARVQLDQPTLSMRDGLVSAVAAALSVGGGASGGREGPIIQVSSAMAGHVCRWFGVRPTNIRALVAAGAAAGIAASFNTPLGGAFFALEIIVGNFAVETFAPVVAATVAGTVVGEALLGDRVALHLPAFALKSPWELPLYLVLGGICTGVAWALKHSVVDLAGRVTAAPIPAALRSALTGLAVGAIAAAGMHPVMGNGYAFIEHMLAGQGLSIAFLAGLLVAKVVATGLTAAGRTGAGLFAPSLFLGAVTGTAFGSGVHTLWPDATEAAGAYGMVGMGAVAAAVMSAPITMTLMLFEMTGNYNVILPLLLALSVAGGLAVVVRSRSVYELELERRGISLAQGRDQRVMHELTVADVMRAEGFEIVTSTSPLTELTARFLRRRVDQVYVVDAHQRLLSVVDIQDVKGALANPDERARAIDVATRPVPPVRPTQTLAEILPTFFDSGVEQLPVVDTEGVLLAVLAERDVVAAYHREVLRKNARVAHVVTKGPEEVADDFVELPPGQVIETVIVGEHLGGRTLRQLALPERFHCTVVAVSTWDEAQGEWHREAAAVDRVLAAADRLVVLGPGEEVERLLQTAAGLKQ